MKNLVEFMTRHGFKFMMAGFALTLGSLVFFIGYVKNLDPQSTLRQLSFGLTIAGFAIWITGRIFVQIQRRAQRLERMRAKTAAQDDDKDDQ